MKIKHFFPNLDISSFRWERMTEAEKKELLGRVPCREETQTPNFFVTLNHNSEMEYGLTARLDSQLADA